MDVGRCSIWRGESRSRPNPLSIVISCPDLGVVGPHARSRGMRGGSARMVHHSVVVKGSRSLLGLRMAADRGYSLRRYDLIA